MRNQYNQVSYLTQNTTLESDETQENITHKSQEVSPFPAGDHKAAMNRQDSMTGTKHKYQIGSTKEAPSWNGQ